jgi:hypothetical protein
LINKFIRIAALLAAIVAVSLLAGCLRDGAGVVTREGAIAVPGLSGHWEFGSEPGKRTHLFITQNGVDYTIHRRGDTGKPDVFQGVYLIPLSEQHAYVASLPDRQRSAGSRNLFVVKVLTQSLLVYSATDEHLIAVARSVDVPVGWDRSLPPTAKRENVLRLMNKLAQGSIDGGEYYRRAGAFKDVDTDAISIAQADALKSASKPSEAASMLVYLAHRGSANAQIRLADMLTLASGIKKNTHAAAWYLLAAHRTGHPEAATLLAKHLQVQGIDDKDVFKTPSYWLAVAVVKSNSKDAKKHSALEDAVRVECATLMASPSSKWKSLAECAKMTANVALFDVRLAMDIEALDEQRADLEMEIRKLKAETGQR